MKKLILCILVSGLSLCAYSAQKTSATETNTTILALLKDKFSYIPPATVIEGIVEVGAEFDLGGLADLPRKETKVYLLFKSEKSTDFCRLTAKISSFDKLLSRFFVTPQSIRCGNNQYSIKGSVIDPVSAMPGIPAVITLSEERPLLKYAFPSRVSAALVVESVKKD